MEIRLQAGDLLLELRDLGEQKAAQLPDRLRQPGVRILHGPCQPADMGRSLRSGDAVLRQVTPQSVDGLRALTYQKVSRAEQHSPCLLLFGLHRHEAHGRTLRRLADRLRVRRVVLVRLSRFNGAGAVSARRFPRYTGRAITGADRRVEMARLKHIAIRTGDV